MPINCILTEQEIGKSSTIELQSIQVWTPPNKTEYYSQDMFDKTGMVVIANYSVDGVLSATLDVTSNIIFSPEKVSDGLTQIDITYIDPSGHRADTKQPIIVKRKLIDIFVEQEPTIVEYEYQDTLATAGMVVTAIYSDESREQITPTSISPTALNTVGVQDITVSYKDESVDTPITTIFQVIVNKKKIPIPTFKGPIYYTGAAYDISSPSFWNNYDPAIITMEQGTPDQTFSETNAGEYVVGFMLLPQSQENYQWVDGSVTPKYVQWTINKAFWYDHTVYTATLDSSNYSKGVNIVLNNAVFNPNMIVTDESILLTNITLYEAPPSYVSVSFHKNIITIKGDGVNEGSSTPGEKEFVIHVGGENVITQSIRIYFQVNYFDLPFTNESIGNTKFWSDLQGALNVSTETQRSQCVGRKVKVTLTSPVLGTTDHYVRCIGYDCDGDKTLTFQTMNCLGQTTTFATADEYKILGNKAWWTDGANDSNVRKLCKDYYNAFPGKDYIYWTGKRYCINADSDSNVHDIDSTAQHAETVFLPSENEMGWNQENVSYNSTRGYASGKNEFSVENTANTPYQYYTGNNRRLKYLGTDTDPEGKTSGGQLYCEKSRYYSSSYTNRVCYVNASGAAASNAYTASFGFAPAFAIGPAQKILFEDGVTGDAAFWNNLKTSLSTSTVGERAKCLGKKVYVTLTQNLFNTKPHYVRCIGYDCDGDKTLTFQTMNCLDSEFAFVNSAEYSDFNNQTLWTNGANNSTVRKLCNNYYNAFPGKSAILHVGKRYCSKQESDNYVHDLDSTEEYLETAFLPSENEMGFVAENVIASTANGYGSGKNEFAAANTNNIPYQYYNDATKRIKYLGTDNDPEGKTSGGNTYWIRSRYFSLNSPSWGCIIEDTGVINAGQNTSNHGVAPAFVIGNDPPALFEDGAIGDATFWTNLKNSLSTSTIEQRWSCLGRKVKVTLTSPVLGTTDHYVRCIGYDCDGDKTLTFQTMNCLAERTLFGSSNIWLNGTTNSTPRAKCIEYYNLFPGKSAIRSVNKKYCSLQQGTNNQTNKTYIETCFLPSYAEIGFLNETWPSSMLEFATANTNNIPYQYYNDATKRIKYLGTDNDPEGKTSGGAKYWTRSINTNSTVDVCCVDTYGSQRSYDGSAIYCGLAPAFAIG